MESTLEKTQTLKMPFFFCQNMQDLYLLYKGIHYMAKTEKNEVS